MTPSSDRRHNRTQTLLRGIQSSGLCVLYHNAELNVELIENLPPTWPAAETIRAHGDAAVFDPFTSQRVLAAKREVFASGEARRIEAPQQRDGEPPLWFELTIERDDDDGVARGLFVSITDISQLKRREAALRELLYEVSHRSRNLLAILQSILGQTASNATSVAEFETKFRGRIASLAQSQDLITYANWQGVRLRRLVDVQTEAFAGDAGMPLEFEGGDPVLAPNTALHLGLALHELAANSAAYGVFSSGAGRLVLACTPIAAGHRIEWIEDLGLPTPPVEAWGFGRTILQHVVPRALRAEARYAVDEASVRYTLDLPQADFEPEA